MGFISKPQGLRSNPTSVSLNQFNVFLGKRHSPFELSQKMYIITTVLNVGGRRRIMEELKQITPEEVKNLLEEGETLNLIDVREDEEVAQGMIPEAVHIPMGEIPDHLDKLDKNQEYIIICRSGRRSENVSYFLQDHGYKVRNMTGGMLEYKGETKPKL